MTAATIDVPLDATQLESELGRRYRNRLRNLRVRGRRGRVELEGDAESYYVVQLVIRDVLAQPGTTIAKNRINVRAAKASASPATDAIPDLLVGPARAAAGVAVEPVAVPPRRPAALVATGDADFSNLCRTLLERNGFDVTVARDGVECVAALEGRPARLLVIAPPLPWGGADGLLQWAAEEGVLAQAVIVLVEQPGSPSCVTPDVLAKLPGLIVLPQATEAEIDSAIRRACAGVPASGRLTDIQCG